MAYTTIDNPELYFKCVIYTATTAEAYTDNSFSFQPDFIWLKNRDTTYPHHLFDAVRGADKGLSTNSSDAEQDRGSGYLTSFDSDGFTTGTSIASDTSDGVVACCWKESATAGFDIVSYTGNGSGRTLSHSLSAVPEMIIHKERGADGENWPVYTKTLDEGNYLMLSTTAASAASSTLFNDTAPTSSVFSVGADAGTNGNTKTYIAYLFAPKQGYSKFGSYEGNGNADGTFVYTGFKPAFLLYKNADDGARNWSMNDTKRSTFNPMDDYLLPNLTNAEGQSDAVDFLSNGFKLRSSDAGSNDTGETIIYMAFAEAPFVNSEGVPCNAR